MVKSIYQTNYCARTLLVRKEHFIMANMSVARGTLFLASKSKYAVNALITDVFTRAKSWHYIEEVKERRNGDEL